MPHTTVALMYWQLAACCRGPRLDELLQPATLRETGVASDLTSEEGMHCLAARYMPSTELNQ